MAMLLSQFVTPPSPPLHTLYMAVSLMFGFQNDLFLEHLEIQLTQGKTDCSLFLFFFGGGEGGEEKINSL